VDPIPDPLAPGIEPEPLDLYPGTLITRPQRRSSNLWLVSIYTLRRADSCKHDDADCCEWCLIGILIELLPMLIDLSYCSHSLVAISRNNKRNQIGSPFICWHAMAVSPMKIGLQLKIYFYRQAKGFFYKFHELWKARRIIFANIRTAYLPDSEAFSRRHCAKVKQIYPANSPWRPIGL
jgi:hypothetical protein